MQKGKLFIDGKEIKEGSMITDFRGEEQKFLYVTGPNKVYVEMARGFRCEYYATVYGGKIVLD